MRTAFLSITLAVAAAMPAAASAATLFSEDFQSITGSTNFVAGQNVGQFTVTQNDVDVFGTPITQYVCGTAGNTCLDLNGNADGSIRTDMLTLTPGTKYTVTFDLGGNGQPSYPSATYPYTLDVSFAGVTRSFSVAPLAPLATQSFDVTATSLYSMLSFTSTSSSVPSYWGPVLDNIRVTAPDAAPAVPEPASWAMMVAGFGMLGAAMRRSKGSAPGTCQPSFSVGLSARGNTDTCWQPPEQKAAVGTLRRGAERLS